MPSRAPDRAWRRHVADEIERLIAILDHMDGDPDDEPSLGWTRTMAWGKADDCEEPNVIPFCFEP